MTCCLQALRLDIADTEGRQKGEGAGEDRSGREDRGHFEARAQSPGPRVSIVTSSVYPLSWSMPYPYAFGLCLELLLWSWAGLRAIRGRGVLQGRRRAQVTLASCFLMVDLSGLLARVRPLLEVLSCLLHSLALQKPSVFRRLWSGCICGSQGDTGSF